MLDLKIQNIREKISRMLRNQSTNQLDNLKIIKVGLKANIEIHVQIGVQT